jgi:DNA-binding transcriptional LysR family regulator
MVRVSSLDWSLVRTFLAVAEHGSLSAAARALGSSQPTLGRNVRAMQEALGIELFRRGDRGLSLTDAGEGLLPAARAMRQAALDIELAVAGRGEALEGTVRITSSVVVATYQLPPIIARLRRAEPLIAVELFASDQTSNLHFREADIAVRMYRPTQLDLVTLYLGELHLGIFAAKSYVERRGLPRTPPELLDHDLIGFDSSTALIEGFAAAGFPVTRDFFKVRCDAQDTYWQLVVAGAGVGFGQRALGRAEPAVVEVPLALALPTLPVYLSAHESVRHGPRVRKVWDHLAVGLRAIIEQDANPKSPRAAPPPPTRSRQPKKSRRLPRK